MTVPGNLSQRLRGERKQGQCREAADRGDQERAAGQGHVKQGLQALLQVLFLVSCLKSGTRRSHTGWVITQTVRYVSVSKVRMINDGIRLSWPTNVSLIVIFEKPQINSPYLYYFFLSLLFTPKIPRPGIKPTP